MSKRKIGLGVVGVMIGVVVLGTLAFMNGWFGTDRWVAQRVVNIANTYFVPEMAFGDFEYDAPYGVTLTDVTMTAPDGTEVVSISSLVVRLAQPPTPFGPIVIESIELDTPELDLIRDTVAEGFALKGLIPFVEAIATEPDQQPEDQKLSDVLQLNRLSITNGRVLFDDGSGTPMVFTGLTMGMDIEPRPDDAGIVWHSLKTEAGAPASKLTLEGKVNMDSLVADIASLTLDLDLSDPSGAQALPSQLQAILASAEARGTLNVFVSGTFNAQEPLSSELTALVRLDDVFATLDGYQVPIESGAFDAEVIGGVAQLTAAQLEMLNGTIELPTALIEMSQPGRPVQLAWDVNAISLRELIAGTQTPAEEGEGADEPDLAGIVTSSGALSTRLGDDLSLLVQSATSSAMGDGRIEVMDGRLMVVPILTQVLSAADLAGTITGERGYDDEFETDLSFGEFGITLEKLRIKVPVARFRGEGLIGWDQSLDLRLRGGAVERVPLIGQAVGAVSGRLVQYLVRGSIAEPKIGLRPIGLQDGSDPEERAAEAEEEAQGDAEGRSDDEADDSEKARDDSDGKEEEEG